MAMSASELSIGDLVYLQIKPASQNHWTGGRIVEIGSEGCVILARVPDACKNDVIDSIVKVRSKTSLVDYIVVKGRMAQLRRSPPMGISPIVVESQSILMRAFYSQAGEEEPMVYVTASSEEQEPLAEMVQKLQAEIARLKAGQEERPARRVGWEEEVLPNRSQSLSSRPSSFEMVGANVENLDGLANLTSQMRKLWEDGGEVAEEDDEDGDDEFFGPKNSPQNVEAPRRAVAAPSSTTPAAVSGAEVQSLVMLEMLKLLKELRNDDAPEGGVSANGGAVRGIRRTMKDYRTMRERVHSNPNMLIRNFKADVAEELGLVEGQPLVLRDFARKVSWGPLQSLKRVFEMLIAIFELLEKKKGAEAQAQVVQCMKCIHQVTLDGGSWKVGWLLTGLTDPTQRKKFGGREDELEVAYEYLNTLEQLQKKIGKGGGKGDRENEEFDKEENATPGAKRKAK